MKVVPMTEAHVRAIVPQDAQADQPIEDRVRDAKLLMASGSAYAAIVGSEVVCLAGVQRQWDGRAMAWCLLSKDSGRRMVALTRAMRRFLNALDYARIEMYVDTQFGAGCRLAELLGFENETPKGMRGFLPNGNSAFMYGRAR
jgi:hypothetical protein